MLAGKGLGSGVLSAGLHAIAAGPELPALPVPAAGLAVLPALAVAPFLPLMAAASAWPAALAPAVLGASTACPACAVTLSPLLLTAADVPVSCCALVAPACELLGCVLAGESVLCDPELQASTQLSNNQQRRTFMTRLP
jgi:hypothetical protein